MQFMPNFVTKNLEQNCNELSDRFPMNPEQLDSYLLSLSDSLQEPEMTESKAKVIMQKIKKVEKKLDEISGRNQEDFSRKLLLEWN